MEFSRNAPPSTSRGCMSRGMRGHTPTMVLERAHGRIMTGLCVYDSSIPRALV